MFPKTLRSLGPIASLVAMVACFSPTLLDAQAAPSLVATRITQPLDENSRVTLQGTLHPLANRANDRGAAPDSMQLDRLTLFFKRSDTQEATLKKLISDLHTPGSASYHKWLTPDQFGSQFGPSDQDLATVQSWLSSHGFAVTKVNAGRQSIEFSGNVAQFRDTFHAQIHKYAVNGETHYANATAPQIPAALSSVIGGFASLNNFRPKSYARKLGTATYNPTTGKATPQWTIGSGAASQLNFPLLPADYAVQYDLNPLYQAGTNGSGQTIAIVNDSNINVYLVQQFRTLFNVLPTTNVPQVIIDGNDPGVDGINNPDGPNGHSLEAYLDVEWSGAVAPNAQIDLVIGADTALETGLFLALEHAIFGNVAPVVSLSFGACEAAIGSTNAFLNALYAQGAAQGQTILVSSGDNGSAGCDNENTQNYAVNGQAVSGYASTPYNVAVGGTDFYYSQYNAGSTALNTQLGTYWNTSPNNSTPTTSILGVIPEQPWNDSQYGLDIINYYTDIAGSQATSLAGGSGGASNAAVCSQPYTTAGVCPGTPSGYPKPSWQSGTGVPADNVRDIPDVSLFASDGSNLSYYPICSVDGDCQPASSGSTFQFTAVGGTSGSAPSFAGIMALVNQLHGPQGQADFVLYPLASQFPTAFHDVTNGTNSVPCNITTAPGGFPPLDCIAVSNPITIGGVTEGQIGTGTTPQYNATAGYDLATGLGTVDANVLVTNWNKVTFASSNVTLTPSQTSFAHGTSVTINGSVTGTSPTGNVALMTDSTEPLQASFAPFALNSSGSYSGSLNYLPGGTYNIWGQYGGDSKNAASTSAKTQITVSPENSGIFFNLISPGRTIPSGTGNIDYGTQIMLSAMVAPSSQLSALENCFTNTSATCPVFGPPTGTVTFADGTSTLNTAVMNAEGDAEYNAPFGVGSHSVTASYSGDNSYNKSTASAITFTVVQDTPVIGLNASNAAGSGQFANGQPTVFNIEVLNGAAVTSATNSAVFPSPVAPPTGTVTVSGLPGGTVSATLSPTTDPTYRGRAGVATITVASTNTTGNYTANVSYSGDSNYKAVSNQQFPLQFGSLGGLSTTTTATMSGNISPSTSITISGTVTGQSGHSAPGNYFGGIGIFSSGNYLPIATIPLSVPSSGDVSTFSATLNSQTLFQGSNFITLQYLGDQTYNISATTLNNGNAISNPLSDFSMVPATTILSIPSLSSTTINLASTNSFAGTVALTCSGTNGVGCSFDNASPSLSAGGTAAVNITVNNNNVAKAGTYNVTVTGKDSTGQFVHTLGLTVIAPVASPPPALNLTGPSGITIVNPGDNGTGTLNVSAQGGLIGQVTFTCSVENTPTGITCSAPNATITSVNAASTLTVTTTSASAAGNYTADVTAMLGSTTSQVLKVPITLNPAANFSLAGTSIMSLTPGATSGNTSTITATPNGGFTGSVNLSCSLITSPSGASNVPTCSIPSSVDITSSSAATATMTISSTAMTSGALDRPLDKLFAAGGGATLALVFFFGIPARRRSWRSLLGVLVFAAIVGLGIGCGSSGGNKNNGGGGNSGTTAGTYTFTVTGSDAATGKITQSAQVNVTFN